MQLNESDLQSRAERLVQNEVNCCLSYLVSTLANGYGTYHNGAAAYEPGCRAASDLQSLCEQAAELSYPVLDYEEAAIQEGWTGPEADEYGATIWTHKDGSTWACADWQALCDDHDIEPYDREVFEHWAVSNWLAGELEAQGEKVDTDFAGLNVWARTTTGQAISIDGVIRQIVQNLHDHFGG